MDNTIKYWMNEARLFRNRAPWVRTSQEYRVEHPLCEICKANGRLVPSIHVDHHTVPLWKRLRDDEDCFDRLRALCAPCHSRVTAAEKTGGVEKMGCDVDGIPLAPSHPWNKA